MEEKVIISQKVNVKLWQGFTQIIFMWGNWISLFDTPSVRLGNYDIPKLAIFLSGHYFFWSSHLNDYVYVSKVNDKQQIGKNVTYSRHWQDERKLVEAVH